jgi:exonuclease VII small subunit
MVMSLSQQIENLERSLSELSEGHSLRKRLENDLFRLQCLKEEADRQARHHGQRPEAQPEMSESERANRAFVCAYAHFNGEKRASLPERVQRSLDKAVWALQDGYGKPGYTPAQGWDWSGIRDSSPEAFRSMAVVITAVLQAAGLKVR